MTLADLIGNDGGCCVLLLFIGFGLLFWLTKDFNWPNNWPKEGDHWPKEGE